MHENLTEKNIEKCIRGFKKIKYAFREQVPSNSNVV